jgi:hypothetical protein
MMTLKEVFDDLGIEIVSRQKSWRSEEKIDVYDFSARSADWRMLQKHPEKREVFEYVRVGPCALFMIKLHDGGVAGFTYNALAFCEYKMQRFYGLEQYQSRVAAISKHAGKEVSYREGAGKIDTMLFAATLANESIKGFRW